MNPLAYTKCAGRLLMALAAIASILLLASCGSSSSSGPPAPNNQGFNNSNLKGTYVFSISGTDIRSGNESFFAFVGTIAADGNGNITGGTVDINDANLAVDGRLIETIQRVRLRLLMIFPNHPLCGCVAVRQRDRQDPFALCG